MTNLQSILVDPKVAAAIQTLQPAIPVFVRMGLEWAAGVMSNLAGGDRQQGLLDLRKAATDAEWGVIQKDLVESGKLAVIAELDDRDFLRGLAIKAILLAAGLMVGV